MASKTKSTMASNPVSATIHDPDTALINQLEAETQKSLSNIREIINTLRSINPTPSRPPPPLADIYALLQPYSTTITISNVSLPPPSSITTREKIVYEILLPSLISLYQSYENLDSYITTTTTKTTTTTATATAATINKTTTRHQKNKPPPPPPPGLLSLQNYTDIAILIELLLGTSLLPHIPPPILPPTKDRLSNSSLPSSLRGRFPRYRHWMYDMTTTTTTTTSSSSSFDELSQTTTTLLQLLTSSSRRFIIFLPRCLVPLHASIYLLQHNRGYDDDTSVSSSSLVSLLSPHLNNNIIATVHRDLLSHGGTRAPSWLKRIVGDKLRSLVEEGGDVNCLVEAFVGAAAVVVEGTTDGGGGGGGNNASAMSAAAIRLAKVLVSESSRRRGGGGKTKVEEEERWWRIVGRGLLMTMDGDEEKGYVASVCVYASLLEVVEMRYRRLLLKELRRVDDDDSKDRWVMVVRRMGRLLMGWRRESMADVLVNGYNDGGDEDEWNVMGMMLRIVANAPVASVKEECVRCLEMMMEGLGDEKGVLSLMKAVITSPKDQTHRYQPSPNGSCELTDLFTSPLSSDQILADLENRCQSATSLLKNLPPSYTSNMFHCLLLTYLSATSSSSTTTHSKQQYQLPPYLTTSSGILACMNFLPLLCENCPMGDILSNTSILTIMKSILHHATISSTKNKNNSSSTTTSLPPLDIPTWLQSQTPSLLILNNTTPPPPTTSPTPTDLSSTTSLCLSLLLTLLQLGNPTRSPPDEKLLQSFLPLLETLSSPSLMSSYDDPTLSEMASHAATLIASRGAAATTDDDTSNDVTDDDDDETSSPSFLLKQASMDLQSPSPPLRARALSTLRTLVHTTTTSSSSLISSLDDDDDDSSQSLHHQIMKLTLTALSDDESYVFLSAIQTLVVMTDRNPQQMVSVLVRALSRGILRLSLMKKHEDIIKLTDDQRVRLGDVLMFVIRRRGDAIGRYGRVLMEELLGGARVTEEMRRMNSSWSDEERGMVYNSTRDYFTNAAAAAADDDDDDEETKSRRLSTGGPLYTMERQPTIVAGCLSCLAELVTKLPVSMVVDKLRIMMRYVTVALRCDESRMVRRAASFLAKSLYERVLLEEEEEENEKGGGGGGEGLLSLGSEMARGETDEEALLHAVLKDVVLRGGGKRMKSGEVWQDAATVARCEEALEMRDACVERGAFLMGVVGRGLVMEESRTVRFVKGLLGESDEGGDGGMRLDGLRLSLP